MDERHDSAQRRGLAALAAVSAAAFALVWGAVGARIGWVIDTDAAISHAAGDAAHAHRWVVTAARAVTQLGNPLVVDAAAALLALSLLFWRRRWWAVLAVLSARLAGLGLEHLVKAIVDRPRPSTVPPLATAAGSSFPSGHSVGVASVAGLAAVLLCVSRARRAVVRTGVVVVALVAGAVAASRVLLVVHYPSDVIGGLLLGVAAAATSIAVIGVRRCST